MMIMASAATRPAPKPTEQYPVNVRKNAFEPKGISVSVPQVDRETGREYMQPLCFPRPHRELPISGRGIKEYEFYLGIDVAQFKGMRVLDAGAGLGVFGRRCRARKIDVTDLDPVYGSPEEMKKLHKTVSRRFRASLSDTTAKVAQNHEFLPFRDASFDVVLSCYAALFWAPLDRDIPTSMQVVKQILKETVRVLRPGGVAYLSFEKDDKDWTVLSDLLFDRRRWRKARWELNVTAVPVLKIVKRG